MFKHTNKHKTLLRGEVNMTGISEVKALTFDLFGTVLDLGGSLTPHIAEYLVKIAAGNIYAAEVE